MLNWRQSESTQLLPLSTSVNLMLFRYIFCLVRLLLLLLLVFSSALCACHFATPSYTITSKSVYIMVVYVCVYWVLLLRVETSFNISPTSVCARVLYIMVMFFMVAAICWCYFLLGVSFLPLSLILSFSCRFAEAAYEMISEWTNVRFKSEHFRTKLL